MPASLGIFTHHSCRPVQFHVISGRNDPAIPPDSESTHILTVCIPFICFWNLEGLNWATIGCRQTSCAGNHRWRRENRHVSTNGYTLYRQQTHLSPGVLFHNVESTLVCVTSFLPKPLVNVEYNWTGIDYTHPSLGGGFGPGHKVIGGHDFVGDAYDGESISISYKFA